MHTVRHDGQVIVIDHVPADVCSVCGDALLEPDTVRRIESLLDEKRKPAMTGASLRVCLKCDDEIGRRDSHYSGSYETGA